MSEENKKTNITIINPFNSKKSQATKEARDLLEICESGECVGFTAVLETQGGSYRIVGTSTMSRLQTAGALLEAAVNRLGVIS